MAAFSAALARGEHWGLAAKACLEQLAHDGANVGILYVTEAFNQNLSSILTFLRETTRIPCWTGAVVAGVMAGGEAESEGGALAVMVGHLPEGSFRVFHGLDADGLTTWLTLHRPCLALAHGDGRVPGMPGQVAALSDETGFVVGGLVSPGGPPSQIADQVVSGGLAGLLLGAEIPTLVGITQGCAPLGGGHRVTASSDGVLMTLDGRPALEALKEEAGQLIARDLRRAAGYIHVALPVAGSDRGEYVVRMLLGIDPHQGWLAVGDSIPEGGEVMFVRRDPHSARLDLERMVADVTRRMQGRRPLAAFYHSCLGRGRHMFGSDQAELELVRAALGDVPLLGFFGHGEFAGERLYAYTGVLSVLLEPGT